MPTKSSFNNVYLQPDGTAAATLALYGPTGSFYVGLKAPTGISANTTIIVPTGQGATGQVLTSNGNNATYWQTLGSGVTGPTGPAGANAATGPTGVTGSNIYTATTVITKSADETVTSSAVLQADNALTASLAAGVYWIEFLLLVSRVDTTNSVLLAAAVSASSNGTATPFNQTATASSTVVSANGSASFSNNQIGPTTNNAGVPSPVKIVTTVILTGTTTVTLNWAQSSSSSTGVTVHKGSRMMIYKTGS